MALLIRPPMTGAFMKTHSCHWALSDELRQQSLASGRGAQNSKAQRANEQEFICGASLHWLGPSATSSSPPSPRKASRAVRTQPPSAACSLAPRSPGVWEQVGPPGSC